MKKAMKIVGVVLASIVILLLIVWGVLNYTAKDWSDFNEAVKKSDYLTMDEMLKNGYDINNTFRGINHLNLMISLHKDVDIKLIKYLIDKGIDVNHLSPQGVSILHMAAFMNRLDIVDLLIKNKADINQKSDDLTLLDYAVWNNYLDLIAVIPLEKAKISDKMGNNVVIQKRVIEYTDIGIVNKKLLDKFIEQNYLTIEKIKEMRQE